MSLEFLKVLAAHILIGATVASLWLLWNIRRAAPHWLILGIVTIVGAYIGSLFDNVVNSLINNYRYLLGGFNLYPTLLFSMLFLKCYLTIHRRNIHSSDPFQDASKSEKKSRSSGKSHSKGSSKSSSKRQSDV